MIDTTLLKLAHKLYEETWLITSVAHETMCKQYEDYIKNGNRLTKAEDDEDGDMGDMADDDNSSDDEPQEFANTAIVKISGPISKNVSFIEKILFGAVDVNDVSLQLDELSENEDIENIILWIDSPGGNVNGVPELAEQIKSLATFKNVYAYSDTLACSAAYWLMSQAEEVFIAKSARIGNVGSYTTINTDPDRQKNTTVIKAGKYKAIGSGPVSDDQMALLQKQEDAVHSMFKNDILSSRPTISSDDMEGQAFMGMDAVNAKMADGIYNSIWDLLAKINDDDEDDESAD